MKRLKFYLKRIYRLAQSFDRHEEIVWNDLKKMHSEAEWKSGVYEKERIIETLFEISTNKGGLFYYMVYDGFFHCRVKIFENYPTELTSEIFILAAHFNNLLNNGVVVVNVHEQYVEYHQKKQLLIPLLYPSELHTQLLQHYNTSKDIYYAYQRLIFEQESPAIIIADIIKNNQVKDDETK